MRCQLAGIYQPTAGRILIGDVDLADLDLQDWRTHISGAFQDHANFELIVRESIGIGALDRISDEHAVLAALHHAAADNLPPALPHGLNTQLGTSWTDGTELSGGQWQRLAIARAMMRTTPLLQILDEPTSAIDVATEHALFEKYAAKAKTGALHGSITILVTHRFSTVAVADLVVVLDKGRITEIGIHDELLTAHGAYAELYELQARGYR